MPASCGVHGPGRNHDALRPQFLDFVERDLIVAAHFELLPHLAEILREVVGKRIVVVEQQKHRCEFRNTHAIFTNTVVATYSFTRSPDAQFPAPSPRARALFTVSSYSRSGTESATIPPPACM